MPPILQALVAFVRSLFRSRLAMQVEILALRHQLGIYQRTCARPRLKPADRMLWAWLSGAWPGWREALVLVKPETVIAWETQEVPKVLDEAEPFGEARAAFGSERRT